MTNRIHGLDREVFAGIPQKIQHGDVAEPVHVIDDLRRIGFHIKIKEMSQLLLDAFHIMQHFFTRKQIPLG